MWLRLSLLLLCSAVFAVQGQKELVRCKHLLCEKDCEFGQKTDHLGCLTCQCEPDPCEGKYCAAGFICKSDLGETTCIRKIECPVPMCLSPCEFGVRENENGCETCTCNPAPCETAMCDFGMKCQNHKCSEEENCEYEARCVSEVEPPQPQCPGISCMMECKYGFKKDDNGCEKCECNDHDPCEDVFCAEHEVCKTNMSCQDRGCHIKPGCVAKPLCQHLRDGPSSPSVEPIHRLYTDGHHVPTCQQDSGEFEYKQCDEQVCWCVDDRGVMIPDTLTDNKNLDCTRNRTHAVDVHFNMTHNHPNIHKHLASLQEMTLVKVTEWLLIEKDYVTGLYVLEKTVDVVEVHFQVVRGVDDEVDLSTAVFHFHYTIALQHMDFDYQGSKFTPDPTSVKTEHHYEPQLPSGGGVRPRQISCWFKLRSHLSPARALIIATSVCIFIAVSVMLCCVCRRMKRASRQKYDTQKANLAFTNDLYNTMHLGDEQKYKLHLDNEPEPKTEEKQNLEENPADASMA